MDDEKQNLLSKNEKSPFKAELIVWRKIKVKFTIIFCKIRLMRNIKIVKRDGFYKNTCK